MKRVAILLAAALFALSLSAADSTLRVVRSPEQRETIDIHSKNASLFALLEALELHLGIPIEADIARDRTITFQASRLAPWDALDAVARSAGLAIENRKDHLVLRLADEPGVTMHVKDLEVREILRIVKEQCGIRNLIVDPDVDGKGTFLFNDVPCSAAFKTILNSLGLAGEAEDNSVVLVGVRR